MQLFALAEEVDLAETAFHDALARRNEAQIAYLREPSIMTRKAFEEAKTAEALALEILDTEVRRVANTNATTVIGLKLKASYASERLYMPKTTSKSVILGQRDNAPKRRENTIRQLLINTHIRRKEYVTATNSNVSGPRFFGLRTRAGRSVESAEDEHAEA